MDQVYYCRNTKLNTSSDVFWRTFGFERYLW